MARIYATLLHSWRAVPNDVFVELRASDLVQRGAPSLIEIFESTLAAGGVLAIDEARQHSRR